MNSDNSVETSIEQLVDIIVQEDGYFCLALEISPNEEEVLVVRGDPFSSASNNKCIWSINLTNSKTIQLISPLEDAHSPTWSPDGQYFVYISKLSGTPQIWLMNRDGSGRRKITEVECPAENPFEETSIIWSPCGKKIAFTLLPNGSRSALNNPKKTKEKKNIIVHKSRKQDHQNLAKYVSSRHMSELHILDLMTGENSIIETSANVIKVEDWTEKDKILYILPNQLIEMNIATGTSKSLYKGNIGCLKRVQGEILIAEISGTNLKWGKLQDESLTEAHQIELPGFEKVVHYFNGEGTKILFTSREGISNFLYCIDTKNEEMIRITDENKVVYSRTQIAGPVFFRKRNAILFPYSGPSEPLEIYESDYFGNNRKLSNFSSSLTSMFEIPRSEVIRYKSGKWMIESILILPKDYDPKQKYPTLVYLHGGPEGSNLADFTELNHISNGCAAHFLASQGYAVLLPNFRGSSGYGQAFMNELGNLKIMRNPFDDVMAGIDHLIELGITDPNKLGVYGFSYGGGLATWSSSQTNRFQAVIGVCGIHDFLNWDRNYGLPFHAFSPNRLGQADPKDMWTKPEVYKELSTTENIQSIQTPILLIETGNERITEGDTWNSWSKSLFHGLLHMEKETYLVCYPEANHGSDWSTICKKDYLMRILTWFDYCIKGESLPEWFSFS